MYRRIIILLLFFISFAAKSQTTVRRFYLEVLNNTNAWTDSLMQTMTVREKAAQLLMIAVFSNKDTAYVNVKATLIKEHKVGGLIFFQGNPVAQAKHTNYYQSVSSIPLLIGMDAEWGVGMRLDGVNKLPFQIVLGATQKSQLSYEMGREIARQFRLLGMHINFAPVADINNNPDNPVINVRSMGEDRQNVTNNIVAMTRGMQDGGILACAKHFPGHGNTDVDSHFDIPTLNQSRAAMYKNELYPFQKLIDNKIAAVMVGHLRSPALDTSLEIASLSLEIIRHVLRQELAFNGLVVSDGMQMKAVTHRYNAPQANMYALLAGNDILVYPKDIAATIDSIENSVASGEFPIEVLDAHCRRVLNTKYFFKLHQGAPLIKSADLVDKLNAPSLQSVKEKIIENAIILATDKKNNIPLKGVDTKRIAFVEVGEGQGNTFFETARQYADIQRFSVKQNRPETYQHLLDTLSAYQWVIVGYCGIQQRLPKRHYDMNADFCNFLLKLARQTPTIMALFASPYTATQLVELEPYSAVLIAHDMEKEYQKAAAEAIFGAIPIVGKSPVAVPNLITLRQGIERKGRIRLKYGTPQELKLAITRLNNIDSIIERAIADKAFPGCQVLAAHKGVVFYNESFGYHTYENQRPVRHTDLYDVASLSKVLGTLPMIMKMYENKTLALNDLLYQHIRFDTATNKKNLKISDLLMHQSGLKAWLPLHTKYLVSDAEQLLTTKPDATHSVMLYPQVYINTKHHLDTNFFSTRHSATYPFPVADNIWANAAIRKNIYAQIDRSALNAKTYNYSDLGFYYLQRVIEKTDGIRLDKEVERLFYKPMNMRHTTYLPLQKFSKQQIVPTELESVFRMQLIHGYVHDAGATIMGGVAGHAGLFSTANDIAVYLQMLLWKGSYGGVQFFKPATVNQFTQYQNPTSHRALGFDKPERDNKKMAVNKKMSLSGYGHTGFTGTMIWVDPDRELIYVFLSNRVHPSSSNNLINTQRIRAKVLNELMGAIDGKLK